MAAEWDHSGNADSATISETRVAAGDSSDAYDVDPDVENYAAGNSPETAYRNQGNPDGSNGWSRFVSEGAHEETGEGDYGDGADQYAELDETHGASEAPDLWGDIHPDAANYPGLDSQAAASAEERESPDHRESEPDRDDGADIGQPDQAQLPVADTRRDLSSEQQQISAFEAKVEAKFADMKAEYDARFEEMRAESGQVRETASAHDQSDDKPAPWADQPKAQDAADATHAAIIAENKTSDEGMDRKESEGAHWRRAASAENVAIASGVAGVADTLAQFAMHASPEGVVGLGAAVLGLASLGLAKLEKKRTEKP
jgi:hypothetical protein